LTQLVENCCSHHDFFRGATTLRLAVPNSEAKSGFQLFEESSKFGAHQAARRVDSEDIDRSRMPIWQDANQVRTILGEKQRNNRDPQTIGNEGMNQDRVGHGDARFEMDLLNLLLVAVQSPSGSARSALHANEAVFGEVDGELWS